MSQQRDDVIKAAILWVDRISDHPNSWADTEDHDLIDAVKALTGRTYSWETPVAEQQTSSGSEPPPVSPAPPEAPPGPASVSPPTNPFGRLYREPFKYPEATPEERAEAREVLTIFMEQIPEYTDPAASIWGATTALLIARGVRRAQ